MGIIMDKELKEALEQAEDEYICHDCGSHEFYPVLAKALRESLTAQSGLQQMCEEKVAEIDRLTPKAIENEALREKLRVMGAEKDRHQQLCALGSCDRERELLAERDSLAAKLKVASRALEDIATGYGGISDEAVHPECGDMTFEQGVEAMREHAEEALSKIYEEAKP